MPVTVHKKQIDHNYVKAIHTEIDLLKNTLLIQDWNVSLLCSALQYASIEFQF